MKLKAAIFDLDGVIVDTVPLHFKAWQKMFNDYGIDFTFNDYKEKVDGIPRPAGCRAILTDASDEIINEASSKKQEYYLQLLEEEGITVYDSTVVLLKNIIKDGLKTAVVSSSKNCIYILEKMGLMDLFQVKLSGNDITKGKPDPQIFMLAAEKLSVACQESVVFEDATLGVEGAKRANMKCVGVDRHNTPELFKKADIVVGDLEEIDLVKLHALFN